MIHCVLHDPDDSVAVVVVEGVKAGTTLTGLILDEDRTITLPCVQDIPIGHKVALKDMAVGDTVIKYGVDIGKVVRRSPRASTPTSTTSRPSGGSVHACAVASQDRPTFRGYRRENGRVGVRNHVIILPVDDLSNAACEAVAQQHQGHARDSASVRPAAVRRRPRPAFPHADRHRLPTRTSPRSS